MEKKFVFKIDMTFIKIQNKNQNNIKFQQNINL